MTEADAVFQSYGRCCKSPRFLEDFYENFMASSDAIKERFKDTDMSSQYHLLRSGLLWMILRARGMSDTKLKDLGESHNRNGYNIPPQWYDLWLEALLKTVAAHDEEYTSALAGQWRSVMLPGIEMIRSRY
ncbi:globin [Parendozoicomonas haliclonae]|uniref:Globin n=1 Tax=Parendozoicomonas haliclonae TaxID=1960125 RepID=A0A1X7ALR8_9GAMM|nr:globin [Parendozoicomonas haliclonae]SMA46304.1 hypothetical protein EHSB41UT_02135 [Parendozoicomonas haliclonae]